MADILKFPPTDSLVKYEMQSTAFRLSNALAFVGKTMRPTDGTMADFDLDEVRSMFEILQREAQFVAETLMDL